MVKIFDACFIWKLSQTYTLFVARSSCSLYEAAVSCVTVEDNRMFWLGSQNKV